MPKLSAGLLLYRIVDDELQVLIGHPGGPFWARKDDGAWSIPKGEYAEGEDPWTVACREFEEELGKPPPTGPRVDFAPVRQPSGKIITAFAVRGAISTSRARSPTPSAWNGRRGSGKVREFPEIDRVAWFPVAEARSKLLKGQRPPLLDRLLTVVEDDAADGSRSR